MKGVLHHIGADLMPDALTEWAAQGAVDLEHFLAKHARFQDYLLGRDGDET